MRANEFVVETKRKSAAVKLQGAWERQQAKSTASRQRADQAKADFDKQWKEKKDKEQSVAEDGSSGGTSSGSIASVSMPLGGKKKKKGAGVNLLGGPIFRR